MIPKFHGTKFNENCLFTIIAQNYIIFMILHDFFEKKVKKQLLKSSPAQKKISEGRNSDPSKPF